MDEKIKAESNISILHPHPELVCVSTPLTCFLLTAGVSSHRSVSESAMEEERNDKQESVEEREGKKTDVELEASMCTPISWAGEEKDDQNSRWFSPQRNQQTETEMEK